ncbi:MAG: vitamin B12-dependent ribonucleotide reductase [Myxococcota bacterium]
MLPPQIEEVHPLASAVERRDRRGIPIQRRFSSVGIDPFDAVEWTTHAIQIIDESGHAVFSQDGVQAPSAWSPLAVKVVASRYFRGHVGDKRRETSVRALIGRVAETIAEWGRRDRVFQDEASYAAFRDELVAMSLHQRFAFNSPVWFNVGVDPQPQCSACFINSVDDSLESILELAKTEARLFKGGSGTGTNLSVIRASMERIQGGGTASGPVSFMRGFDAFAGVIKSGGKTRRAAKMVILNADHPDIRDFIDAKAREERKAWALIEQGYDGSFNGEAYQSVFFQNANHSVRVTDDFMRAALAGSETSDDRAGAVASPAWPLRAVTTDEVIDTVSARELLMDCARAAHVCGDPGIQFDTTINIWNPCRNSGRINASNPCSEYMFLDDSACNLGSLNLLRFLNADGEFDIPAFEHAVRMAIIAQEIIVENSSYPTDRIAAHSHAFRPLGLGYANLGALLMQLGLPYDSDAGRAWAAAITALMGGMATVASAELAAARGPFSRFEENREPFLEVLSRHRSAAHALSPQVAPQLREAACRAWDSAFQQASQWGVRNAQVTVIAPTGTIAFMMDCDSTGIEPDIALIKFKRLAGGGTLEIVNQSVEPALLRLGYEATERRNILDYIDREKTIEGAPGLKEHHLPVFDCAFRSPQGSRSIKPEGHVRMMAAVQPFLSGAISKTVNVPSDATEEDIFSLFVSAWRAGVKAVAVYRDGSKRTQPLSTSRNEGTTSATSVVQRRRLEAERASLTHKFSVGGHSGYITVGLYPDGTPGEIFITMSKEGSTISGLMDTIATSISLALQYGVPLRVLVNRFSHMRFEPSGFTGNPDIPMAKSIVDYIFRWLGQKFLRDDEASVDSTLSKRHEELMQSVLMQQQMSLPMMTASRTASDADAREHDLSWADAPPCHVCGSITLRTGTCYACPNCGATSGCS